VVSRGALQERHSVRHRARELPADVRVRRRAAELDAAVLPRAEHPVRGARVQLPAAPGVSARRPAALAVWGVPAQRLVAEAEPDVREQPPEALAEQGAPAQRPVVAAEPAAREQQPAGSDGQVRPRAAQPAVSGGRALRLEAARGEARRPAAALADARRQAVPDAQGRSERGAASACRPDQALPSVAAPARRRAARFVRAMLRQRTASPSAQSWQAARDEVLSCSGIPGGRSGQEGIETTEQFRREDEPPAVGPDCGEQRIVVEVYFDIITGCMFACSGSIQKKRSDT
jgi:hypothetical protein